jgi:hypothetical protein
MELVLERDGNAFSGSGGWQTTVNGNCGVLVSGGETIQVEGTRLNTRRLMCMRSSTTLLQKFVTHPLLVALTVTPFATFAVKNAKLEPDAFKVKGVFTLGTGSDGIAPSTEEVTLQVGNFTVTIPPGSFRPKQDHFQFEGTIAGVSLVVMIAPRGKAFAFRVEGEGVDLTAAENPLVVSLSIGNDGGSRSATAKIEDEEEQ